MCTGTLYISLDAGDSHSHISSSLHHTTLTFRTFLQSSPSCTGNASSLLRNLQKSTLDQDDDSCFNPKENGHEARPRHIFRDRSLSPGRRPPEPGPIQHDDDDSSLPSDEEYYEVERILDRKIERRGGGYSPRYLVRWKNCTSRHDRWKSLRELKHCREFIEAYDLAHPFAEEEKQPEGQPKKRATQPAKRPVGRPRKRRVA